MMRVREALAGAALCAAIAVPAGAQPLLNLQKVADGVYAALATPRSPINCNAAVVVLDDAVLVVDTHSRPSSAKALIAQIRTITDKPVRFAVNTHFHWDHAQGNHAYPVAFPKQVAIVASEATRENLRTLGGARLKDQLANTPASHRPRGAAGQGDGRGGPGAPEGRDRPAEGLPGGDQEPRADAAR